MATNALWLRSCPKCKNGDIYIDKYHKDEIKCIQCGLLFFIKTGETIEESFAREIKKWSDKQ